MNDPASAEAPASPPKPAKNDLKVLFPGRTVQFKNAAGEVIIEARVMPLRYKHIKTFYTVVEKLVGAIIGEFAQLDPSVVATIRPADGTVPDEGARSKASIVLGGLVARVVPRMLVEIDPLFRACIDGVDLDELPHECVPVLLQEWIDESFSADKIRPWLVAAETVVQRMTGQKLDLTSLLSIVSSRVDTAQPTSSSTPSLSSGPSSPLVTGE